MKMKWGRAVIASLLCIPAVWLLALGFGRDPHAVPFVLKGQQAPPFSLQSLAPAGTTVSVADFRGRAVVLNFWASWCLPCADEQDVLEWGAREFRDTVQFMGVVYQDSAENARAYLERRGWKPGQLDQLYPQLLDSNSATAIDYGVAGVPETYFIDAHGVTRSKFVGPLRARDLVRELRTLGETAEAAPQ